MELRETLKSKSEEGDAYITEIEVCWDWLFCFLCFPSYAVLKLTRFLLRMV